MSHHSSKPPKEPFTKLPLKELFRKEAEKAGLGATGKFPEGQLDDTDEGELRLGVAAYKGKVVINFGKPIAWFAMTPEQADTVADMLRSKASEARSPIVRKVKFIHE